MNIKLITMFANYYSPSSKSIGQYRPRELFYNACKADYTVDECMNYFNNETGCLTSAIVTGRNDVVEHLRQSNRFIEFFRGNYTTEYMQMLLHRDMTPSNWANMIIDYSTKEKMCEMFQSEDRLVSLLRASYAPIVSRLANHFGIKVEYIKDTKEITPETIILRYKLGMKLEITPYVHRILCCYDSVKFPTYDLLEDICSGNYHEVARKVNTGKSNVQVQYSSALSYNFTYLDYTGTLCGSLPIICYNYLRDRLATIGQCKHYLSLTNASTYLSERKLSFI